MFIYDELNRLIRVTTPTNVIEYSYDPSGKRISRTLNGRTEYYVYHGINEFARIDEAGNVIELRVPGISAYKDILRPVAIETQNAIYAPVQNLQGTITAPIWAPYAAATAAGVTIGYWGYKGYKHWKDPQNDSSFNLNTMERSKKGGIDPNLPKNPKKDKNWEDISHPKAKSNGHHKYKNKKTGEEIRLDKGDPKETGHDAHDHYHRLNPNKTGDHDAYLDAYGRPVPEGSDASHLYPPEWVWW